MEIMRYITPKIQRRFAQRQKTRCRNLLNDSPGRLSEAVTK
jgi:hypothetical protein